MIKAWKLSENELLLASNDEEVKSTTSEELSDTIGLKEVIWLQDDSHEIKSGITYIQKEGTLYKKSSIQDELKSNHLLRTPCKLKYMMIEY
ncbi:hypothetical protein CEW46_21225 [Bacillus cereus]|nr:hypothetical protein CEW46_21225 [Bacillus cereus]